MFEEFNVTLVNLIKAQEIDADRLRAFLKLAGELFKSGTAMSVYLELCRNEALTANEIAMSAGIPLSAVYRGLKTLRRLGLIDSAGLVRYTKGFKTGPPETRWRLKTS